MLNGYRTSFYDYAADYMVPSARHFSQIWNLNQIFIWVSSIAAFAVGGLLGPIMTFADGFPVAGLIVWGVTWLYSFFMLGGMLLFGSKIKNSHSAITSVERRYVGMSKQNRKKYASHLIYFYREPRDEGYQNALEKLFDKLYDPSENVPPRRNYHNEVLEAYEKIIEGDEIYKNSMAGFNEST